MLQPTEAERIGDGVLNAMLSKRWNEWGEDASCINFRLHSAVSFSPPLPCLLPLLLLASAERCDGPCVSGIIHFRDFYFAFLFFLSGLRVLLFVRHFATMPVVRVAQHCVHLELSCSVLDR